MSSAAKAPNRKRRNGLAAFRAVELEVHAGLSAGRTVLAIYEEKRDRLAMSYAQFARYVQPLRQALTRSAAAERSTGAAGGRPVGHLPFGPERSRFLRRTRRRGR